MTPAGPAWLDVDLPLQAADVRQALVQAHDAGALDLPLPGHGSTLQRWTALAELAALDLTLGRLAEAHADAVAILAELAGPAPAGLWGVWAAEPPGDPVRATVTRDGWLLDGQQPWCSGALVLDRALVSALAPDGRRLFAVEVAAVEPQPGSWAAVGLAATGTLTVALTDVPARAVGSPRAYLDRPGFWHGGAGVAACWYGGALGAARVLLASVRRRDPGPHALAHLGAVDSLLAGMHAALEVTARFIDAEPADPRARWHAARLRAHVEAAATEVLDRVGRALGPAPLCQDPMQAQRAADLPVYLRQSHAERDLAALGALAVEHAAW